VLEGDERWRLMYEGDGMRDCEGRDLASGSLRNDGQD